VTNELIVRTRENEDELSAQLSAQLIAHSRRNISLCNFEEMYKVVKVC
jgi:hypothetical protein